MRANGAFRTKPCRAFNTPGGCKYGAKCRFIHDEALSLQTSRPSDFPSDNDQSASLRLWMYKIPKEPSARPLGYEIHSFFKKALELVASDDGTRQEVVSRLASNGGLLRIDEAVNLASTKKDRDMISQFSTFREVIFPMLQVLTHTSVASSLLLEAPLSTILNFLYGPNGHRTVALFRFITTVVANLDSSKDLSFVTQSFEVSLNVLSRIVDLNGGALLLEELKPLVEGIADGFHKLGKTADSFSLSTAEGFLRRIQQRLNVGEAMPIASATSNGASKPRPIFKLQRDAPGWLSDLGPRHDNDKDEISEIRIMPTASEIQSSRYEYLPSIDPLQWHIHGANGLLDRQFRLLREDTIGQIRDAIKAGLDARTSGKNGESLKGNRQQGTRMVIYRNAYLVDLKFHRTRGLDLIYGFDQPEAVQSMSSTRRKEWWQASRRMQHGSFVCILDAEGIPIFCSVAHAGLISEETMSSKGLDVPKWANVHDNEEIAFVALSLVDTDDTNLDLVLSRFLTGEGRGFEELAEFPGILLPSFQPILQSLQKRSILNDLPFSDMLVQTSTGQRSVESIPPPIYALKPGFSFDLSCLTRGEALRMSPDKPFDVDNLQRLSNLDAAQAAAFVDALRRRFALIQGPPGTGKSYTGVALTRALLANRDTANLGPIICVCMTNHALDQLLEDLVSHGVEQIVRVGSRSKSQILEELNLRNVMMKMNSTKTERQSLWKLREQSNTQLNDLNKYLQDFSQSATPQRIQDYLSRRNPQHATELFMESVTDEDGFTTVRYRTLNPVYGWLHRGSKTNERGQNLPAPRSVEDLEDVALNAMTFPERQALFFSWISDSRNSIKSELKEAMRNFLQTREDIAKVKQEMQLRCLLQAHVIGITTSGLARISDLLRRLNSKVMICEEAGEVLEAHTLTALLPSIEHAILIGDHLQLRPQIANYDLQRENPRGMQFSFDVSLFERLVLRQNSSAGAYSLPFSVLETQRRMHPRISELIRSQLYPTLEDAPNVSGYPAVTGMRNRLFWFDHDHIEAGTDRDHAISTSHSNDFEIEMVTALVSHLARQGVYKSNQIAVITPYLGQLRKLKRTLGNIFTVVIDDRDAANLENQGAELEATDGPDHVSVNKASLTRTLRVATIDNFQGEEAEIVVISLVRSNKEDKCGFLRTSNRINVLLSRAKHGMYIIGNARTASSVEMWSNVIDILKAKDCFGRNLELQCPRHPDTPICVQKPDDFSILAPEAGCNLKCVDRLTCGHACIQKCHSRAMHLAVKCLEPCQRSVRGCDIHSCPRSCGEKCPTECSEIICDVLLSCGHFQDLKCHIASRPQNARCEQVIKWQMETCGHVLSVECWKTHPGSAKIECFAACNIPLPCGHICKQGCSQCRKIDEEGNVQLDHGVCRQPCKKPYQNCRHACTKPCHEGACAMCEAPCDVRCVHSACNKRCSDPCSPCAEERCSSACPHGSCPMPCSVPCTWIPCSRRCERILSCGHQCPGVCGEQCPDKKYCQTCAPEDVKDMEVDFIMNQTYGEINIDEDPCIFLQCGHICTMSNLDAHFDMKRHYSIGSDGRITAILSSSTPFNTDLDMKGCPLCRGSLRDISRYGRIVRSALLDESSKRLERRTISEHAAFEGHFSAVKHKFESIRQKFPMKSRLQLDDTRKTQLRRLGRLPIFSEVFREVIALRRNLFNLARSTQTEAQPFHLVWSSVQNVRRKGIDCENVPGDISSVRVGCHIYVAALLLRVDLWLITQAVQLKRDDIAASPFSTANEFSLDLNLNRVDCETLINEAQFVKYPAQVVEGHVLWAQHAALENSVAGLLTQESTTHTVESSRSDLLQIGLGHIEAAKKIVEEYPMAAQVYLAEIEQTEKMLRSTFYEDVSNEERRLVLQAMARDFQGGNVRWYNCANGHPFAVGECGRPMEETRCPQCQAPVGGRNHEEAEGVTRAVGLEDEVAGMHLWDGLDR